MNKNLIGKIRKNLWILRFIIPTIIFNFRVLPFKQAIHLPIILYKPKLLNNTGKFIIKGNVSFGMIKLGKNSVSLFPNSGITIQNRGTIIFNGNTLIGNDSALSLGEKGILQFGQNFTSFCGLKIACYHSIKFGKNALIGWNVQIMDTDFHALKCLKTDQKKKSFGIIEIGNDVWVANGCKLYKNVIIPDSCIIGADTNLHQKVECEPHSIIVNKTQLYINHSEYYLDRDDDQIDYSLK